MRPPTARPVASGLMVAAGLVAGATVASSVVSSLNAAAFRQGAPAAPWKQHDVRRPRPPVVEPADGVIPAKAPKDAVILFDGTGLDAWRPSGGRGEMKWKVVDGALQTVPGAGQIETKAKFGDIQLHVEWASPVEPAGKGQDRGNSGVFLMGQFEVQVLDSYRADTYADGQAGAIYGQYPPLANAARPPGQWQAYDIAFRRPRFDSSGALLEPARITLFHNGILVQDNEEPVGPTSWLKALPYKDNGGKGPIALQDHDHPVRYRNVWLRELPERPAPTAEQASRPEVIELSTEALDRFAGPYRMGETKVAIAREGGHLTVTFPFRPGALPMVPVSESEFEMTDTDGHFAFRKDDSGRVTGVLFRIGDGTRDLVKEGR